MSKKFKPINHSVLNEPVIEKPVVEEPNEVKEPEEIWEDAKVNGVDSMLNIRSAPEKANNVIGLFPNGTPCKVLKANENSDWFRIIIGDPEVEGYAMKKYIKIK